MTTDNPKSWVTEMRKAYGTSSSRSLGMLAMGDEYIAQTFDFNVPYQRGLVWLLDQKQKLIDSLLTGIHLPAVYLREHEYARIQFEVIDGKQRLTTLIDFVSSRFEFRGMLFRDWDIVSRRMLLNGSFASVIVRNITDEQAVEIFNRVNFCGVPQEDRKS